MDTTRRSFLAHSPAAAVTGLAAAHATGAAAGGAQPGDGPLRIGCLNVGAYSHLRYIWGSIINPVREQGQIPLTGMRITHCWDIEPERARQFADTMGCEVVKDFDGMLGKVDAVINGGYYNHPWNHIIHEPYLRAGLPNLVNRPFANSMSKARRILDMAREHGAPLMAPSALEHNDTVLRARKWASEQNILCYSAANSSSDYPTHGVHGIYMVMRAIAEAGNPVVSVAVTARDWAYPPAVVRLEHRRADGAAFHGQINLVEVPLESLETLLIHSPEASEGKLYNIRLGQDYPYSVTEFWAPTMWAFQRMAMYSEAPQTHEQILHKTAVFMAGWYSHLERDGAPVRLDEVPEGWTSPVALPTQPQEKAAELYRKRFGDV